MKLCDFQYSDGVECLKPAVACIVHADTLDGSSGPTRWYCAEHYDGWMDYYQRVAQEDVWNTDAARRICKRNRL